MTETAPPSARPFQVDLRGVVDLLGRHLYSGPRVYLRELVQNARDAVHARADLEPDGTGRPWEVRIHPAAGPGGVLRVVDDGAGLTAAEVGDLLATVGRSSKRDLLDLPREGLLGRFGIGLLSCFMVTDEIIVRSRSVRGDAPVEWVGSADGTFSVRELTGPEAEGIPVGTEVRLAARPDDVALLDHDGALGLARTYARFLDVTVRVARPEGTWDTVTQEPVFAATGERRADLAEQVRAFGRDLVGAEPFDTIELAVPATGTRGTAYVLPFAPPPGARQASVVHLGGMLLDDRWDGLLPDWAFFVRAVVDTTGLRPTASREALVEDDALELTRAELGAAVRRWVLELGLRRPGRLAEFVAVHERSLKGLVVHDDELASFVLRWLRLETSVGVLTVDELVTRYPEVRYTETVDEFRQVAALAPPDRPVVNGGYVHDADVVRRLPDVFDGVRVARATVEDALDALDVPPLDDRATVARLEDRAGTVLDAVGCDVVVRRYEPADVPALYLAGRDALRALDRGAARRVAPALWAGVLGKASEAAPGGATPSGPARPRLCLNWSSPLVRTLAATDDDAVLARTVQLLYVQALLAGHRPLRPDDRALLTGALTDLVQLSAAR
ncbi:HSP90 family protein [Luteimicrobium xylanilyticum]|uniref:Chaperone protein HtpG n=1 Tax=Luteimicrobium xylanilyticum TaxID=1133546 RepID=A0A5P9Q7R6_9MICO|nr:HSP90 family protein [Luteimicrobium xylanilyticum]QFU97477.1 Chaperone protein HtpG [Luteimicrobium xylanilyticum]